MPSSRSWQIGTNGTNQFIAVNDLTTETANSSNGTTWAAATPTPAVPGGAGEIYQFMLAAPALSFQALRQPPIQPPTWRQAHGRPKRPAAAGAQAPFSVGGCFGIGAQQTQPTQVQPELQALGLCAHCRATMHP